MQSLLHEEEIYSAILEYRLRKGHNFRFNRWIALTILQGFPEAVFLGVAMESLLRDEEI